MCKQFSSAHVLVVQAIFPDNPDQPLGCTHSTMLCTCSTCASSANPMTPVGPVHEYLERCFQSDAEEAKKVGENPPVILLSLPKLDPRTGSAKPTRKQAVALIKQVGPDALSSEVVSAYA